MASLTDQKAELRNRLKRVRQTVMGETRQRLDQAIRKKLLALSPVSAARSLFCFLSSGTEVDSHGIVETLLQQGKQLAVPKIIDSRTMIAVAFTSWEELAPGQLGILTPNSSEPVQGQIDVCITPGLGFSPCGQRLGFGRGYYDTWFAENPVACKIGIAYECQLIGDLPADETDIAMDILVTEQRVLEINR
ncbi:MAG: 5-formyltetrahydrofolate cyclo-ligase [Gammaproteobacteria bacterium]